VFDDTAPFVSDKLYLFAILSSGNPVAKARYFDISSFWQLQKARIRNCF